MNTYTRTQRHIFIAMCMYVHIYMNTHKRTYTHIYIETCMYIHIHMNTYTRTYRHMYIETYQTLRKSLREGACTESCVCKIHFHHTPNVFNIYHRTPQVLQRYYILLHRTCSRSHITTQNVFHSRSSGE